MFQFSTFASPNLWIEFGITALIALLGFPIQKSSGHSSFDNSPKLFAVYYVFHRLSAPRHPLCALYSLIIHPTPSESFGQFPKSFIVESLTRRQQFGTWWLNYLYRFLLFIFQSIDWWISHSPRRRGGLIRVSVFVRKFFLKKKCILCVTAHLWLCPSPRQRAEHFGIHIFYQRCLCLL